jgi:Lon protease-like protein
MEMPEETEPLTDEELAELPVFPLPRVVFFPGSTLPLHLFEPRYREMMEDCVSRGPMAMAVTLLEDGWEDDYEGRPPIHTIAGAGRILDWRKRSDGRFDLLLHGLSRVELDELPPDGKSYRRARATKLVDRIPHEEPVATLRTPVLAAASSVVALVRERHPDFSLGVDADTPPGLLADRIADRLVPDTDRRQQLLEAVDVKVRLALVQDALFDLLAQLRGEGAGGALH